MKHEKAVEARRREEKSGAVDLAHSLRVSLISSNSLWAQTTASSSVMALLWLCSMISM